MDSQNYIIEVTKMTCKHKNIEHIPEEEEVNIREDIICLDCGISLYFDYYNEIYNKYNK